MCHFVRYFMAFVCQKIKGLLTYLLTIRYGLETGQVAPPDMVKIYENILKYCKLRVWVKWRAHTSTKVNLVRIRSQYPESGSGLQIRMT